MFTSLRTLSCLLAAVAVTLAGASTASAIVVADVKNDFGNGVNAGDTSAVVNPTDTFGTGRWDYFQTDTFGASGSGSLTLLEWDATQSPDFGSPAVGRYERAGVPHAGGSQFDFPIIADHGGYGFTANANEVLVHPSDSGNSGGGTETKGLIRWIAGAGEAGNGAIIGSVRRPSGAASGGQMKIFVDGVEVHDSGVLIAASQNFAVAAPVQVGSVVDFVFDPVANQHNDDSIFLAAAIDVNTDVVGPSALWDAKKYTGGTWVDSIQGLQATPNGNPLANQSEGVFFDGVDDSFAVAAGDNPIAGLDDFTVTAVFEANGNQGEGGGSRPGGDFGDFWQVSHLAGNEQPGAGVGDWGIGIGADQNIQGGVGLQGDQSLEVVGPFNDGEAHIVTLVMDAQNSLLKIFVDGNLAAEQVVTPNTVVDSGFFFGTNGAPVFNDLAFYNGHIKEIGFHEFSLSDAEILAIHSNGSLLAQVPEPTTGLLLLLGASFAGVRRRRA